MCDLATHGRQLGAGIQGLGLLSGINWGFSGKSAPSLFILICAVYPTVPSFRFRAVMDAMTPLIFGAT